MITAVLVTDGLNSYNCTITPTSVICGKCGHYFAMVTLGATCRICRTQITQILDDSHPKNTVDFFDLYKWRPSDFRVNDWNRHHKQQEIPITGCKSEAEKIARKLSLAVTYRDKPESIIALIETFEQQTDITPLAASIYKNAMERIDKMGQKVYEICISSPFILTSSIVKEKLGIGYKIISVEVEKESSPVEINSVDAAAEQIIKVGFRALARAHHPDLGGNEEVMKILNRTMSELKGILASVKGVL